MTFLNSDSHLPPGLVIPGWPTSAAIHRIQILIFSGVLMTTQSNILGKLIDQSPTKGLSSQPLPHVQTINNTYKPYVSRSQKNDQRPPHKTNDLPLTPTDLVSPHLPLTHIDLDLVSLRYPTRPSDQRPPQHTHIDLVSLPHKTNDLPITFK